MIYNQNTNVVQRRVFRLLKRDKATQAGIDTCTLWRLFEDDWGKKELKVYQNLFALVVVPTVYKEFLSMQGSCHYSVARKDFFLELIDADVKPTTELLRINGDSQIIGELKAFQIPFFITDNTPHFTGKGIEVVDSKTVRRIFGTS